MNIHIKSISASLVFSVLLYSKTMGINLVILSLVIISLVLLEHKSQKETIKYALTYLFTALMVFLDPTNFKIFVHAMAFLIYMGKSIAPKNSLYLSWFIGLTNMVLASIHQLNSYLTKEDHKNTAVSSKTKTILKALGIALGLIILFSLLYQKSNPVFSGLISAINFDFLSFPWLLFTVFGYFIFLHILKPYYPETLITLDHAQGNTLKKSTPNFSLEQNKKLADEYTLGSIIFIALNSLLFIFLITDFIYLIDTDTSTNSEYSKSVHQGVYALLLSIICAIAIILYFFRGDLNFYTKSKNIKILCYIWIAMNLILVLFTGYKNYTYVATLGLTYKRIGVFVYLLFILAGLCTTYLKVSKTKSFIYLIRSNVAVIFAVLFVSAIIPWDKSITYYNLNTIENVDIQYLIDLGNTNSIQLKKYSEKKKATAFEASITTKYSRFIHQEKEKSWQEYSIYSLIYH
ncbi:hypothetical protein Celal_0539 [Cellulophaga algicola DSM 14237]|uniref:Uncharacterized protein n=1 Tax=Cellulophaga algicola (strain DSM 14237 / IC166 / ACAM 630) TaxID=688270 RepID=E6XBP3_CELAD|nr:DUF4173 domain-containing protein [Cellulophaga algicola]ADV47878.1 hypothetical protein Celal_0539 [Cellulophaga algicola DSM 14237]